MRRSVADFYGVLWGPAAKQCEPSGATELHKNLPQNPHCLCVSACVEIVKLLSYFQPFS